MLAQTLNYKFAHSTPVELSFSFPPRIVSLLIEHSNFATYNSYYSSLYLIFKHSNFK
jgi:hypothetical protein